MTYVIRQNSVKLTCLPYCHRRRHCRDRLVFEFTISVHHHLYCEFESRSGWGVQHYVIMFVNDMRQNGCFLLVLPFPPPRKHPHDVIAILLRVVLNTTKQTNKSSTWPKLCDKIQLHWHIYHTVTVQEIFAGTKRVSRSRISKTDRQHTRKRTKVASEWLAIHAPRVTHIVLLLVETNERHGQT
jgi:hypothetical protein